jgi:hypothetical protein
MVPRHCEGAGTCSLGKSEQCRFSYFNIQRDNPIPDGFPQSTYSAAAKRGNWNRAELECPFGAEGRPRLSRIAAAMP